MSFEQWSNDLADHIANRLAKPTRIAEGERCPNGCEAKLEIKPTDNCTCHIAPPCHRCVDAPLTCNVCHDEFEWEE